MWFSIENILRSYESSEDKDMWTDPVVTVLRKNNIRPGVWVIYNDKQYSYAEDYDKENQRKKYVIAVKNFTDN